MLLLLLLVFLTAFSCKSFLSQPVIFVLCASNSPLQPPVSRRQGRGEASEEDVALESQLGSNWGVPFLNLIGSNAEHEGLKWQQSCP